jgi:hypothetical protein
MSRTHTLYTKGVVDMVDMVDMEWEDMNLKDMTDTLKNLNTSVSSKEEEKKEVRKQCIHKVLSLMSRTVNYISHPSISKMLECHFNYKTLVNEFIRILLNEPKISSTDITKIDINAVEGLLRSYINIRFEREGDLLIFKDVEALKILYILFVTINDNNHPLNQCYLDWLQGKNSWIADSLSIFSLINY